MKNTKQDRRLQRKRRIRSKITGTKDIPRVSVFIGNANAYVQVINDQDGITVASANTKKDTAMNKEVAEKLAKDLAGKMKKAGVSKAVFDRNGKKYHGKVQVIADTLRSEGITL